MGFARPSNISASYKWQACWTRRIWMAYNMNPSSGTGTINELFASAVRFHQSGQLQQAEALYRQVLEVHPSHADALHLLGILAHQTGHQQAAISLIRQAI